LKENWWKIIIIVLVCLIVDVLLHQTIMPVILSAVLPPSVIVEGGWLLPVVAGTGLLVTFGALAVVFVLLQENLPGKKLAKGLWYGVLFGGLWFLGFVEAAVLWDTTFVDEVRNWLPDGISLVLMSLLLGVFTAKDSDPIAENRSSRMGVSALVVAAFYFIGRYFAYWVMQTNADWTNGAFDLNSFSVLVWTLVMAVWVGVMYAALRSGSKGHSPITRALWFGGVVLGIDWLFFHLFALLFYDLSLLATAVRPVLDVLFIVLGAFVCGRLAQAGSEHHRGHLAPILE
jgi:hypothetical protein